ncbi:DUF2817 domain-containing protein [Pantoea rodasii]|uniref:DUF2817 domain-containing protein n=1 Tax=Pantoea rodasii TaxID=1076549 RepID=A0A2M9W8Y2_9GAMM|nr:DUF2817 domain-containing protein [Pantoea rodasii]ORM63603.1 hypothetical protein HA45_13315 [Pantoea rodasii]PJZ03990.1 DUF2817 domain-containing protein [Pantoea rodasii]
MSALPHYPSQRARFLAAVERQNGVATAYEHPLPGPLGEKLFTDVAVIGDPSASKLMMIISGTHGVEGYYGSDSQIDWLNRFTLSTLPADTAIVLLHLINPWGAAHLRRVNEDNIDLNRNFIDFTQAVPANTAYRAWHGIYHGERASADGLLSDTFKGAGWQAMKRVVEAGQYDYPDGFFYGGAQPSWSYRTLQTIIANHLSQAETILSFDLHTGAGAWGHPMLLSIAEQQVKAHQWGKTLYGEWLTLLFTGAGRDSETGVTATATGYLSQFLLTSLPHTQILPLVVECGTYRGEEMHQRVRDDHWLHLQGEPSSEEGRVIKQQLVEGFWPADRDWRDLVAFRTQQIFVRGWNGLLNINHNRP